MKPKQVKNRFLQAVGVLIILLALIRCSFSEIAMNEKPSEIPPVQEKELPVTRAAKPSVDGEQPHRIYSVSSYTTAFPDSNSLQLQAACRWGVTPVRDHADAEQRMDELVYMDASPYYSLAPLDASIPYLVPRAAILLQDIGRTFFDSLHVKGIPLHRFVVSSVLRTEADVARLVRQNRNAVEKSCHLYGTTFDIKYNIFETVSAPGGPASRSVGNDTLKYVLSEVLRDMRQQGRCYVKYEQRQPCFHLTVR